MTATETTDPKWTDDQRCPSCAKSLADCDWCEACDLDLLCAQTEEGLAAAAERTSPDGKPYLVLAPAPPAYNLGLLTKASDLVMAAQRRRKSGPPRAQ